MDLINLCLTTYFQFNEQIYQQIKELMRSMGSLLSQLIAEPVMQFIEPSCIQLKALIWHIDDIFVIIEKDQLGTKLSITFSKE